MGIWRANYIGIILFVIVVYVPLLSCNPGSPDKSDKQKSPNLLIIIADQWRGQALGFLNTEPIKTPVLDSFSTKSLVLKNFITNYPVCSPSRAMLMTGQYPFQNHVYGNCRTYEDPSGDLVSYNIELSDSSVTWSDILENAGYSLGYIGKWHLTAPHPPYIPTYNNEGPQKWNEWTPPQSRHGFNYWYSYGTYDRHFRPMYWDNEAGRMDFHYVAEWEPKHDIDKAIEFLENKDGRFRENSAPFGLVVSVNPPHSEYNEVPEKYLELYKDTNLESLLADPDIPPAGTRMGDFYRENIKYYYTAISGVDEQIGRIFTYLKQHGLDDNTIIIFMSDHGNNLGKHNKISKNNLYEESLRVPFMIYWKNHIAPGIDSTSLMSMIDFYPTLMELMGFGANIPSKTQGQSFSRKLSDVNDTTSFPNVQYFMGSIRIPDSANGFRGVRTTEYKLGYSKTPKGDIEKYLFNYQNDPSELENIYDKQPEITKNLKEKLVKSLRETNDPFLRNLKSENK